MSRDLGDFQTPLPLARRIVELLGPVGARWPRVLEPTCGRGSFLAALLELTNPPREIKGIELQAGHIREARLICSKLPRVRTEIRQADLFGLHLQRDVQWANAGPLLVLGNPPWVTNAELGALSSQNLPWKRNLWHSRGIDALTGQSNFDLGEAVLIKILEELAAEHPTIVMLCKVSVGRNVLRYAASRGISLEEAWIRRIDAREWFNAAVDGCLFFAKVGGRGDDRLEARVYDGLDATVPETVLGFAHGEIISDLPRYREVSALDGRFLLTWRQGLKHDAASVMELELSEGTFRNRLGDEADIESDYLYPLLKGSDLYNQPDPQPRRWVIVPQTRINEDTDLLERDAPRLWQYLTAQEEVFARRKSSVFAGRPRFSIFGIGPYAFSRYKVAVAGLYKTPRFRALGPINGRPVMLDDTCYFIPCRTRGQAAFLAALLNDPACLDFLNTILDRGAKRPITKALLQRIDGRALFKLAKRPEVKARFRSELRRLHERLNSAW